MRLKAWFGLSLIGVAAVSVMLLAPRSARAACSALPSGQGTVTMTVNLPSSGNYRIWARELAPDTNSNGFYLQVDPYCQITMGDAVIPVNQLTWIDYQNGKPATKNDVTLGAGNHTVVLAGLDAGVEVDKVLFLSDPSCTPTGDGTNCTQGVSATPTPTPGGGSGGGGTTPSPTPVILPPPGSSVAPVTVSGMINLTPSSLPAGAKDIKYYVDGKEVASGKIDTTKLSDGTHTVEVKAIGANGKEITSRAVIVVKNKLTLAQRLAAAARKGAPLALGALALAGIGAVGWLRRAQLRAWWSHWRAKSKPPSSGVPSSGEEGPKPVVVYPKDWSGK